MNGGGEKIVTEISIIIPVYNAQKYIRKCIESILNQTFRDFEIICVDDKSKDNSVKILEEYKYKDNRIHIIHNKRNIGQGGARNVGIKLAKGKYLMFIDQDDWLEPDTFELCYNQIKKNNNDFVIFNYNRYYENEGRNIIPEKYLSGYRDELNNPDIKLWKLKEPFMISAYTWTQIYNTDFIKKNNIKFDASLRMGDDAEFYFGAIIKSKSVSVIDKPFYNYRRYEESVSESKTHLYKHHIKSRMNVYNMFLHSLHKNEYLKNYIPYSIRSLLYYYKLWGNKNHSIKPIYYQKMHKYFSYLNKEYDISQFKDEINYEKFIDIANNSWNKKNNIYFEIPNIIKIYKRKRNTIAIKLF